MHSNKTGLSIPVARLALLGLCVVFLASCRLVIKTDDTGYITSASGANDCNQASCIIPITESFSDTFTAVPADGYRFVRWTGVCSRAVTTVCKLKLSPLPAEFMEFDSDVEMSAIFESSSTRRPWYRDSDGDGFGAANLSRMAF